MKFKDHFSGHASQYAEFRPRYPNALFAYLANVAPGRALAWDCATGNGQAAVALASEFQLVIATDASAAQIENTERHQRITYRVASAEQSGCDSRSIDLVTVAQALHWFDIPVFFKEATRVLKPAGVIAVFAYNLLTVSAEVDQLVTRFYYQTTDPFWPPEREIVESGYRGIEFPFEEITAPPFHIEAEWKLEQLLGYLRTWSATQKFIAARGFDPVDALGADLARVWPQAEAPHWVRWPLCLRLGRAAD